MAVGSERSSYGTVYVGDRLTVVKYLKKELGAGLFRLICSDPGINPREL